MIETDEGKRTIVPGTHVVLLEQDPEMAGFERLEDWVLYGADAPQAHEAAAIAASNIVRNCLKAVSRSI